MALGTGDLNDPMGGQQDLPGPGLSRDLHGQIVQRGQAAKGFQHPRAHRPRLRQTGRNIHPREPAPGHEQRKDHTGHARGFGHQPPLFGQRGRTDLPAGQMAGDPGGQSLQLCRCGCGVRGLAMGDDQGMGHMVSPQRLASVTDFDAMVDKGADGQGGFRAFGHHQPQAQRIGPDQRHMFQAASIGGKIGLRVDIGDGIAKAIGHHRPHHPHVAGAFDDLRAQRMGAEDFNEIVGGKGQVQQDQRVRCQVCGVTSARFASG